MENNQSTNHNPTLAFTQQTHKTWSWKLVDEDWMGEDFAAALEVQLQLGKVVHQNQNYWVIEHLLASPQSIKDFPLEITKLQVVYKEQAGTLAMLLDIEFRLSVTAEALLLATGGTNVLNEQERLDLAKALAHDEGVTPGFSLTHTWINSQALPEGTPKLFRQFLLLNDNQQLTIQLLKANPASDLAWITDPGMDGALGGKADWKVTTNEATFCQPLN